MFWLAILLLSYYDDNITKEIYGFMSKKLKIEISRDCTNDKIDDNLAKVNFLGLQHILELGCCFSKSVLYNIT